MYLYYARVNNMTKSEKQLSHGPLVLLRLLVLVIPLFLFSKNT